MEKEVNIRFVVQYWEEKHEKQADVLVALIERKLMESKYRFQLKNIIDDAFQEVLESDLPTI